MTILLTAICRTTSGPFVPRIIKTKSAFLFSVTVAALAILPNARAWDHGGHMIVAKFAYDRLTPAEQQKLAQALAGLDRTGKSYNAVTAAC